MDKTVTDSADSPRGSAARTLRASADMAELARREFDRWWDRHAVTLNDGDLYEALEQRIVIMETLVQALRAARGSCVRRMRAPDGSLREASARTGRAESTLRTQAAVADRWPWPEPVTAHSL